MCTKQPTTAPLLSGTAAETRIQTPTQYCKQASKRSRDGILDSPARLRSIGPSKDTARSHSSRSYLDLVLDLDLVLFLRLCLLDIHTILYIARPTSTRTVCAFTPSWIVNTPPVSSRIWIGKTKTNMLD